MGKEFVYYAPVWYLRFGFNDISLSKGIAQGLLLE